jgi:hypothetical protein
MLQIKNNLCDFCGTETKSLTAVCIDGTVNTPKIDLCYPCVRSLNNTKITVTLEKKFCEVKP